MAKKQTRKANAKKPVTKKRTPAKKPTARRAVARRTTQKPATRTARAAAPVARSRRTPQGSDDGAPNQAARTPGREARLTPAPDPVLHTQVDREVIPVTDMPETEKHAVANRQSVPFGTVKTQ